MESSDGFEENDEEFEETRLDNRETANDDLEENAKNGKFKLMKKKEKLPFPWPDIRDPVYKNR